MQLPIMLSHQSTDANGAQHTICREPPIYQRPKTSEPHPQHRIWPGANSGSRREGQVEVQSTAQ